MPNSYLMGSFVRRFLLENVIADRNLSRNTQTSYRDAIRLLLRFIIERYSIDPVHLTVEDVNPEVVRNFLAFLEKEHRNESMKKCGAHPPLRTVANPANLRSVKQMDVKREMDAEADHGIGLRRDKGA